MDPEYWTTRWRDGRIGFHEGKPNHFLERYADRLGRGGKVLVPLCGKTVDMAVLAARGHEVVGIELASSAVEAFFEEQSLEPSVEQGERFRGHRAGRITLLSGDIFAATREDVGTVTAVYDRAALVALPSEMRERYVAHVRSIVEPRAPQLVVAFEYPQHAMVGPPFSVEEEEVRRLYEGAVIELLDEARDPIERLKDAGISAVERCWSIR